MRRVVGNCPRCGNPIYEAKKAPARTCACPPLGDAGTSPQVAPVPYVPFNPWYPWLSGPVWISPISSGGTVNIPSVWVEGGNTYGQEFSTSVGVWVNDSNKPTT